MHLLILFLRVAAVLFIAAGALHVVLGLQADQLLGARLAPEVLRDPALDSQNRFYGAAFTLYGVLMWIGAREPRRHLDVLRALLAVLFLAGLARGVSIALMGLPPPLVLALMASELVLPPLVWVWLNRVLRRAI